MLFLFSPAFGSHRGVRHPPSDEHAEENGDDAVGEEEPLPGFEGTGFDEGEAVGEKTADDLLGAVHHVPWTG